MKFLIATLTITFSVNSFAHGGFNLTPLQWATVSTILPTGVTLDVTGSSLNATSGKRAYKAILADANEFRLTGNASAALSESINNIQSDMDVSDLEAVDLLESMAIEGLEN